MARGDKNYDKTVRKVNKGEKAEKKIAAVHKMVEALISGDSDAAAEHLHDYLQETTRALILGEKAKPDYVDLDDDGNKKESMKKAAKDKEDEDDEDEDDESEEHEEDEKNPKHEAKESKAKERKERRTGKEDVKESAFPKSNNTRARGPEFAAGADKGKISGNSLKNKPKKSNDTKARGPEFKEGADKGKISGNSLKNKPKKSNDTRARGPEFAAGADKGKVANFDDGREFDMGTGNVTENWSKVQEGLNRGDLTVLDESLLDDIYSIVTEKAPSAGMSKKQKSAVVKRAKKGEDIGKKGKNFQKVAAKAAKRYGSKEAGERVAAAAMWKQQAK